MAQPRFKFIGTPKLPDANSKRPFINCFEKDKKKMVTMNLGVQASRNSIVFVECFGMVQNIIKTKDTEGNDIEIKWEDRFDKDIVKEVAMYRRYICDLGDGYERQDFITAYDFIMYLKDNLKDFKGKILVNGQWEKQWYKDKYYDKFKASNLYAVSEEDVSKYYITADIYYRKDCVDTSEWKSSRKVFINGYVQNFIKDEGTKLIPHEFVFDASNFKTDDEKQEKLLKYKLKYVQPKSKKWQHLLWDCVMLNGTQVVEFDESQLTDAQKEQIELGIRTIDDFKPSGSIFGDIVYEYRLHDPQLISSGNDDFSDGFIELDITDDDFEEMIYVPAKDEKMSDVMKETEKKSKKTSSKKEKDEEEYVEGVLDKELDDIFDGMNEPEDKEPTEDETEEDDNNELDDLDLFA